MAELILTALLPERKLSHIQSFLEDASQREVTEETVKRWLNGLQHLAYDIDDILDALATDAMCHEFTKESEGISSKAVQWHRAPIF
ncbi:NB-ARC domains-containing protein [Tanacetum coccineum]|uniref:NB-ARC domains-containing protein n=1 Tax=Tanacetum coccineum TaxID=301880 RepID=A0ABQ5B2A9_9ASTR